MRSKPGFSRPCRCPSQTGGNVDRSITPLGSRQVADLLEDRREKFIQIRGEDLSGYLLRRSPTPSYAACPGRAGPLSALLRGAPAGATAPRWGRVQRCGEAWPLAGALGALPRGGAK